MRKYQILAAVAVSLAVPLAVSLDGEIRQRDPVRHDTRSFVNAKDRACRHVRASGGRMLISDEYDNGPITNRLQISPNVANKSPFLAREDGYACAHFCRSFRKIAVHNVNSPISIVDRHYSNARESSWRAASVAYYHFKFPLIARSGPNGNILNVYPRTLFGDEHSVGKVICSFRSGGESTHRFVLTHQGKMLARRRLGSRFGGIGGSPSGFVCADQETDLYRRDNDKSAGKEGQNECEERDRFTRRPLPKAAKWIIMSGLPLGAGAMLLIAWVLGWLSDFKGDERADGETRRREDYKPSPPHVTRPKG